MKNLLIAAFMTTLSSAQDDCTVTGCDDPDMCCGTLYMPISLDSSSTYSYDEETTFSCNYRDTIVIREEG